jgi:general secretion pathway protein F
LLSAGIPLLKALEITQPIINNVLFQEALQRCQERIREGGSMAQTLKESGLFPPMLVHMVSVGERSGELESMLLKVAESYETQTESSIETVMGLIEPVMILFMGCIVGFVVMSILLPIFEMNQLIK